MVCPDRSAVIGRCHEFDVPDIADSRSPRPADCTGCTGCTGCSAALTARNLRSAQFIDRRRDPTRCVADAACVASWHRRSCAPRRNAASNARSGRRRRAAALALGPVPGEERDLGQRHADHPPDRGGGARAPRAPTYAGSSWRMPWTTGRMWHPSSSVSTTRCARPGTLPRCAPTCCAVRSGSRTRARAAVDGTVPRPQQAVSPPHLLAKPLRAASRFSTRCTTRSRTVSAASASTWPRTPASSTASSGPSTGCSRVNSDIGLSPTSSPPT